MTLSYGEFEAAHNLAERAVKVAELNALLHARTHLHLERQQSELVTERATTIVRELAETETTTWRRPQR